jgi:hypothetical protein
LTKVFALIEGVQYGASDNLENWERRCTKRKGMNIEAASPFGMAGDVGFAVDILNQASHSMKMKSVRPVGIGYPDPDPDAPTR